MKRITTSSILGVIVLAVIAWSAEPLDETTLSQFDQILSDMGSEDLIPLRADSLRRVILPRIDVAAGKSFEEISPEERRRIVRELLGGDRYDRAVRVFQEGLSHPLPEYRATSAKFLGKAMGALEAAPALRNQLDFEGARMFGDLATPEGFELNISSILAEVEALAYLRDPTLIETDLLVTLLDSNPPPASATRIIRAMAYASSPGWEETVLPFLQSENVVEAKAAFDVLGRPGLLEVYADALLDGAKKWIPIFRDQLIRKGQLEWDEKVLFSGMTVVGTFIERDLDGYAPDLSGVRDELKEIVEVAPSDTGYFALAWFRFYDNDKDVEWLLRLLAENDPLIRERTLFLIGKTISPDVIIDHAQEIFPLLEDPNRMVQGFAVFALQSGLGWPAANLYSDRELKEAKRKVLEAYAEKGIVPNSGRSAEDGIRAKSGAES